MEKGTYVEMLTPKERPRPFPFLFHRMPRTAKKKTRNSRAIRLRAKCFGIRMARVVSSDIRVTAPDAAGLPPAASYIAEHGLMQFGVGDKWLLEVTLDDGKQGRTKDLAPDLPMIIHP
jgi:hypothetical protein